TFLLGDALLGGAGARGGGIGLAERSPELATLSTIEVGRYVAQGPTLDHPGVAAIGQVQDFRRPIPVLGVDSWQPVFGIDLQVRIAGDVAIFTTHRDLLSRGRTTCERLEFVAIVSRQPGRDSPGLPRS